MCRDLKTWKAQIRFWYVPMAQLPIRPRILLTNYWKFGDCLGKDFFYDRYCLQPNGTVLWSTSSEGTKMDRFGRASQVINVIDQRQSYLQDVLRFSLIELGFEQEGENSIHFGYEVVALSPKTAQELGVPIDEDDEKKCLCYVWPQRYWGG